MKNKIRNLAGMISLFWLIIQSQPSVGQVQWVLGQTVSNVNFYYSIETCGADTIVLLKFENTNSQPVTVSWNEQFDTQLYQQAIGYYGTKTLVLPTGITEDTNCASVTIPECIIFPNEVDPSYFAEIAAFSFVAINVTL